MRSIHERPFPPDDRGGAGHWKGDLIIGTDQQSEIGTLVELQTHLVRLLQLGRLRVLGRAAAPHEVADSLRAFGEPTLVAATELAAVALALAVER